MGEVFPKSRRCSKHIFSQNAKKKKDKEKEEMQIIYSTSFTLGVVT